MFQFNRSFIFLVWLVIGLKIADCVGQEDCRDPDQIYDQCGTACPPTCHDPFPHECPKQCVAGCRCRDGLLAERVYGQIVRCVKPEDCETKCFVNHHEFWNECATRCAPTCANPRPKCTKECVKRCDCPKDKPIYHMKMCVKASECPKCPKDQIWDDCGTACPRTCGAPHITQCPNICRPGCRCKGDLVQLPVPDTNDFFCVPLKKCPPKGRCPGGQEYVSCGSPCTKTCTNLDPPCELKYCAARCQCPKHKPIWHGRKCVKKSKCPKVQLR